MSSNVTFFTPTFARDYDRFCLMRWTMEQCEIDIPHVAVVHEEDMALFQQVPHRHLLRLVSTREALPPEIEAGRTARVYRRRNPLYWVSRRSISGWWCQQIAKLASSQVIDTEGIVCMDSETVFIQRVEEEDFRSPCGKLYLHEGPDERLRWVTEAARFLDIPPTSPQYRYIYMPALFHRQVLLLLHQYIEQRYGKTWATQVIRHEVTEFSMYGMFARYIDKLAHQVPHEPDITAHYWKPTEVEDLNEVCKALVAQPQIKAVCFNSTTQLSAQRMREVVERVASARSFTV